MTWIKSFETLNLEIQHLAHSHADYICAGSTPWSTGQGEATPVGTRRYLSHQMPDPMILTTVSTNMHPISDITFVAASLHIPKILSKL